MNKEKQGKKLRFNLKSNPIMGVLIPLIFIMLVTQIFNHNFLTGANLSSILKSIPFLALATLGASFPLLIGCLLYTSFCKFMGIEAVRGA